MPCGRRRAYRMPAETYNEGRWGLRPPKRVNIDRALEIGPRTQRFQSERNARGTSRFDVDARRRNPWPAFVPGSRRREFPAARCAADFDFPSRQQISRRAPRRVCDSSKETRGFRKDPRVRRPVGRDEAPLKSTARKRTTRRGPAIEPDGRTASRALLIFDARAVCLPVQVGTRAARATPSSVRQILGARSRWRSSG